MRSARRGRGLPRGLRCDRVCAYLVTPESVRAEVSASSANASPANSNETDPEPDPPRNSSAVASNASAAGVTESSRSPEPRAAIESTRRVEGVKVGGTIGSTTLVPVMYNVGGLQIFDVPGFKDTDEERQVVINILHKCLLTRVQVRPRVLLNVALIGWCNG